MKMLVKKKVCLLVCFVLLVIAAPQPTVWAAESKGLIGDVDGNHSINVCDVARLYAHFQGNSLVGQEAMNRADLQDLGWLYPEYTERLYAQTRGISPQQLWEAYRRLPDNTQMSSAVTLTGRVVAIKDGYSAEFKNISVMLEVEGWQEHILCYRMAGDRMDYIDVNEQITVTGILCNYQGRAEFAAGCQGAIVKTNYLSTDAHFKSLIDRAYHLPVNASSRQETKLNGRVVAKEPVTSDASEISITIQISEYEEKTIRCYGLAEDGVDLLRIGQKITVIGILRNSNGTVEFAPGCEIYWA
jgi:hypothetical protein